MKNIISIAAVVLGFVLSTAPADAATKVFLLGGQSNMAGVGNYPGGNVGGTYYPADPLPADSPYYPSQSAVKFWNNNAWTDLRPGFGYQSGEFGPEVSFGYTLNNLFPEDDIYLVKYGVSSTSLAVDWNPNGTGTRYNVFKSMVNAAINDLNGKHLDPVVAGMIWMQGESDTTLQADAEAYAANLTNFIEAVRSDFSAPDMKFVAGRILDIFGPPANNLLVRSAIETVTEQDGNASWIPTDNLQRVYPGHYGTQGQIDLGISFADEFVVPEPSALSLLGAAILALAVAGLMARVWRKKQIHGTRGMLDVG